jgi:hypothetical protein
MWDTFCPREEDAGPVRQVRGYFHTDNHGIAPPPPGIHARLLIPV